MKNILIAAVTCMELMAFPFTALSQKKGRDLIDSLQTAASRPVDDTLKAMALGRLGNLLYPIDINKAFPAVNASLQLSEKLHWKRGIANGENNLGMLMSDTGNAAGARVHLQRSYQLNIQRDSKFDIANNLLNIGRTYSFEGNYPKATDYYFKALKVAESISNEQKMGNIGANLASAYTKDHNYPKAIEWGKYTVDHAEKAKDTQSMRRGLAFTGIGELSLKDTAAAKPLLDRAVDISRRANMLVDLGEALGDRAEIETDLNKRIKIEQEADTLMTRVSPRSAAHLEIMTVLGRDYLQLAKNTAGARQKQILLRQAVDLLTRAKTDAEARHNPQRLADILLVLVDAEEYQGMYKEALANHRRFVEINDSLYSQDSKNRIAGLEAKHTVDLKDAELQVSELKISNQRKTAIGLIAGLAVLALLGALLYRQSLRRQKANAALQRANTDLEEANKLKARFFGILSHDLRGPVANLLHFLTIQKEAPDLLDTTAWKKHQQEITASAEDLLNTMEEMLLWSKQQMQNFQPNQKDTPVADLFEYLQKFFPQKSSVSLLFQTTGDIRVFTDQNYLQVIMQNLTSNAMKALQGRADARVEWSAKKEGTNIVLSIKDNGPGLPAGYAMTLYDDSVTANARNGFGLYIVRDLAKAIQCPVRVWTKPGKGTEFSLTLPAV